MLINKCSSLKRLGEVSRTSTSRNVLRASAESVDRERFIVSSAESGGSTVGGVRPGEAGRTGDTLQSCCTSPACAAAHKFFFPFFFLF